MSNPSLSSLYLLLPLVLVLTACSGSGVSDGVSRDRNVISSDEIHTQVQASNAYDIVRTLRPQWLRARSADDMQGATRIWVYVDGTQYGDVESLRQISVADTGSIRYLNAAAATLRYGQNHTQGAIEVTTAR
jgi:hypothetical protein